MNNGYLLFFQLVIYCSKREWNLQMKINAICYGEKHLGKSWCCFSTSGQCGHSTREVLYGLFSPSNSHHRRTVPFTIDFLHPSSSPAKCRHQLEGWKFNKWYDDEYISAVCMIFPRWSGTVVHQGRPRGALLCKWNRRKRARIFRISLSDPHTLMNCEREHDLFRQIKCLLGVWVWGKYMFVHCGSLSALPTPMRQLGPSVSSVGWWLGNRIRYRWTAGNMINWIEMIDGAMSSFTAKEDWIFSYQQLEWAEGGSWHLTN